MKYLIFILTVFLKTLASAQVSLGPVLQLNYTSVNGDIKSSTFKPGFGLGLGSDIKLDEKLIIEPSIIYTSQASSFTTDSLGKFDLRLNYITVPIMIKFFANDVFNLQLGFQSSYLANSELKQNNTTYSNKTGFNKIDFGLNFGCGYYITKKLHFNILYNVAMSDLNKKTLPLETMSNRVFKLNLNYYFSISKTKKDL